MEFNTFYNKIQTDESMMETIQHGNSEYPFQLYSDALALFDILSGFTAMIWNSLIFTVLTGTGMKSWRFYM